MSRGERPLSRAKTTDNMKVGMKVLVNDFDGAKFATITFIYDRWSIGTTAGSCLAGRVKVLNDK